MGEATPPRTLHVEEVMGTVVSIDVREPAPSPESAAAIADVVRWLHWVDDTFTTYRDSDLMRLNRSEIRLADCPAEMSEVLDLCAAVKDETQGFFDATLDGRLDPTGLVKGWSIERASGILRSHGLGAHSVNGGGDIRLCGEAAPGVPWGVGIADPLVTGRLATAIGVRDGAVATSGVAERGLHVRDPFTGRAATDLASVTIVGPELGRADAYATAAVAMGQGARAWLEQLRGWESFVVEASGRTWWTPGFAALVLSGNSQVPPSRS